MTDKDTIQELLKAQAEQHVKVATIETTCKEIRDSLLGNGKPGLLTRMALLEDKDRIRGKFLWIVVTAVAALGAETALTLLK